MRRRGHPPSGIDEAALVRKYIAGASIRELERTHRVSWHRAKRILLAHGVAIRPGKRAGRPPDYPDDPHKRLALAVIAAACMDWDNDRYPACCHSERCPRAEVMEYFASRAFLADCELAEVDPDGVLRARKRRRLLTLWMR